MRAAQQVLTFKRSPSDVALRPSVQVPATWVHHDGFTESAPRIVASHHPDLPAFGDPGERGFARQGYWCRTSHKTDQTKTRSVPAGAASGSPSWPTPPWGLRPLRLGGCPP